MEPPETRRNYFAPITRAFTDTFLQLRAKPLVFLLIWLTLALAPQLILSFSFQEPVSRMMDLSFEIISETLAAGEEELIITDEMSDIIFRGIRAVAVMLILLAFTAIYLGSVLAGVVGRFRDRVLPTFIGSFSDGLARFPGFLKAILVSALKILTKPVIVFIVGAIVGSLLGQPALIYFFALVSSILFLIGLLRFGLGPFIHLSLGVRGRDAAMISKTYYISHRPVVSFLFMFVIILPMVVVSFLMNLLISLDLFSGTGGMLLGLLQSIIQLTMTVVVINFAMNNFLPQDWGAGDVSETDVSLN